MFNGIYYRSILQAVALLGTLVLTGCVSVPDVIKGTTKTPMENLLSVKNMPELYIGHEGRFGGKVLSVLNEKSQTRLEISAMPLAGNASPRMDTPSLGRVYAYVNTFLEPSDFKDHYVTVVGLITGLEKGKVGNSPYNYVVMNATGVKRWYESQRMIFPPAVGTDLWSYYGNPYNPFWRGYSSLQPVSVETILTE
ncbi:MULTISPECIES: Slp family lipoprotein [Xenorhabdus]|uniref:Slp family lipoprotein n=1 Tax=Xenorhabdus TaxID=626 RepID=UPI000649314A|nr:MULTISPECIES: Slp family lipoprotein [Xenorhabdus]KLU15297.1 membrane protein [Xenorhabdus griffiniae]KOP33619.1 membrane protein [Xenorhabdus sp. GDc328]